MLRRASELFLGALEQKSLVKARLKYVSAEKHGSSEYDQVFLAQEEDSGNHATSTCEASGPNKRKVDSFDVELKWFISDNIEEARKLKRLCVEYSDAREYGKTDEDFTAHKAMRLLEDGSNAVKSVVRCANGVKARIGVEKAMAKK